MIANLVTAGIVILVAGAMVVAIGGSLLIGMRVEARERANFRFNRVTTTQVNSDHIASDTRP